MAQTSRIGIVFRNTSDWTGGAYYILNLVNSFSFLEKSRQPDVIVFVSSHDDFNWLKKNSVYENLQEVIIPPIIKYSFFERVGNKVSRLLTGKNYFEKRYKKQIDIIYPYSYDYFFDLIPGKVYWIPDFQEHYLPEFFSPEEVNARKQYQQQLIAGGNNKIVFSSHAALNDLNTIYPDNNAKTFVVNFASVNFISAIKAEDELRKKYSLGEKFFYSPNQFWKHKNHQVIIDALIELRKKNIFPTVAFSGKESDYRNPGYMNDLKEKIKSSGLQEQVKFLGFIDREDVFALMKYSIAVIQPSLFEGWSTVVEDCKSVNAFILLSDLPVHREQMKENVIFFDPENALQLSEEMESLLVTPPQKKELNYKNNIVKFANDFLDMVQMVKESNKN